MLPFSPSRSVMRAKKTTQKNLRTALRVQRTRRPKLMGIPRMGTMVRKMGMARRMGMKGMRRTMRTSMRTRLHPHPHLHHIECYTRGIIILEILSIWTTYIYFTKKFMFKLSDKTFGISAIVTINMWLWMT